MEPVKDWFCAGFFFKKFNEKWYALCVTDIRFQDEVKPPGGGKKKDEHWDDTLEREFLEETDRKLAVKSFLIVHGELHEEHEKHFYLITEISGELELDEEITIKEPDGKVIRTKFVELEEFSARLYKKGYGRAYRKASIRMRELDPTFPNV